MTIAYEQSEISTIKTYREKAIILMHIRHIKVLNPLQYILKLIEQLLGTQWVCRCIWCEVDMLIYLFKTKLQKNYQLKIFINVRCAFTWLTKLFKAND